MAGDFEKLLVTEFIDKGIDETQKKLIDIQTTMESIEKSADNYMNIISGKSKPSEFNKQAEDIKALFEKYKLLQDEVKKYKTIEDDLATAQRNLIKANSDEKVALEGIKIATREATAEAKNQAIINEKGATSLKGMEAELRKQINAYKDLEEEQKKSAGSIEQLKSIQKLDQVVKDENALLGRYQGNVGNYKMAVNVFEKQLISLQGT